VPDFCRTCRTGERSVTGAKVRRVAALGLGLFLGHEIVNQAGAGVVGLHDIVVCRVPGRDSQHLIDDFERRGTFAAGGAPPGPGLVPCRPTGGPWDSGRRERIAHHQKHGQAEEHP